jgi:hypothetical protein
MAWVAVVGRVGDWCVERGEGGDCQNDFVGVGWGRGEGVVICVERVVRRVSGGFGSDILLGSYRTFMLKNVQVSL